MRARRGGLACEASQDDLVPKCLEVAFHSLPAVNKFAHTGFIALAQIFWCDSSLGTFQSVSKHLPDTLLAFSPSCDRDGPARGGCVLVRFVLFWRGERCWVTASPSLLGHDEN